MRHRVTLAALAACPGGGGHRDEEASPNGGEVDWDAVMATAFGAPRP